MEQNTSQHVKLSRNIVISHAWTTYKHYLWMLLPLMILVLVPGIVENIINDYILPQIPGSQVTLENIGTVFTGYRVYVAALVTLLATVVSARLQIGYNNNELSALDDKKITTDRLFSGNFQQLMSLAGGSIILFLILIVGFIALVIPGIYFAVKLSLFKYYIAQGYGGLASIKASRHATKGNFWRIVGIFLTCLGIVILGALGGTIIIILGSFLLGGIVTTIGAILLLIGTFFALILVSLINANLFRNLRANTPADILPTRLS